MLGEAWAEGRACCCVLAQLQAAASHEAPSGDQDHPKRDDIVIKWIHNAEATYTCCTAPLQKRSLQGRAPGETQQGSAAANRVPQGSVSS